MPHWINDNHTVAATVEQGRIDVKFACPGMAGGCKSGYACAECEGTGYNGDDECTECDGSGRDEESKACWLVGDADERDEAYDGPKQFIAPGSPIEWWCDGVDGEWGWRLLDGPAPPALTAPPVVREGDGNRG